MFSFVALLARDWLGDNCTDLLGCLAGKSSTAGRSNGNHLKLTVLAVPSRAQDSHSANLGNGRAQAHTFLTFGIVTAKAREGFKTSFHGLSIQGQIRSAIDFNYRVGVPVAVQFDEGQGATVRTNCSERQGRKKFILLLRMLTVVSPLPRAARPRPLGSFDSGVKRRTADSVLDC